MAPATLKTGTRWDNIIQVEDDNRYVIPSFYKHGMRTDAKVFSSPDLIGDVCRDLSLEQVANVATLPGIVGHAMAMPDMHQGYGFPIGGVAAMDPATGVVSPGGVGFDINCGVRLLSSPLSRSDLGNNLEALVENLFKSVPTGAGKTGRIKLDEKQVKNVLAKGSSWALAEGMGYERDLDRTEDGGFQKLADPEAVSARAIKRGSNQLGTLGSGNHFLEVDLVEHVFDERLAAAFGLFKDQVCFMIHCGSRGLGHQVCTEHLSTMAPVMKKYDIRLPDRELAACPIESSEGRHYLGAMAASANFAFANRQCITHFIRQVMKRTFGKDCPIELVYDVAHNMAKFEDHLVDGRMQSLLIHRKGATRAFPAGRAELASEFQEFGQPVIIPGDMGRASYVLVGTQEALEESFGSVCHGAGRLMSRTQARKGRQSKDVVAQLKARGVIARASSREGLTEEVPEAYKPIDKVIEAVKNAGLARPVARLKPIGVVKG